MFTLQDTSSHAQRIRSKRRLLIVFIGVSVFAFLLVFISVEGFLDQAFMLLYFGQFLPPEIELLFPAFNLAQLHDIGIILASVGLVIMYLPITLTLVISEKSEDRFPRFWSRLEYFLCYSDLLKVLGFMGLFLASMGVWFCMHQAYLYQGEFLKGTLPTNSYVFLTIEIPPLFLHELGSLFVIYGLIIISSINAIKVVIGVLSQQGRLS